jgi:hypothetical protein
MSQRAIQLEVEQLNEIFRFTESPEEFLKAHDLVDRNHITSKQHKIAEATRHEELKPFRFLVNKN